MQKLIQYENGLRVVVDNLPGLKSVACGIYVGAGSSFESVQINGLSHFTEHMIFKGTDQFDAYGIADAFESYGANINAFTGKEATCYYVKSTDEYAEKCFELLAHIFYDSAFNDAELDKERKVIAEEINMVEDAPDEICYDLLAESLYGKTPLGQTILGSCENVARFKQKDVQEFVSRFYGAENTIISFAGNITESRADAFVRKFVLPKMKTGSERLHEGVKSLPVLRAHRERVKDFEQSNIGIGFRSVPFDSKETATQAVLNSILGGGMSSRLFQAIRENLGLAYSVYTTPSLYKNNGSFNILLNISPENTRKVLDATATEINKVLCGGLTEKEVERAKTQIKSSYVFARESVQTIMTTNARFVLHSDKPYDIDQKIAEINAVTLSNVNEFAKRILKNKNLSTAYVGKKHEADFVGFGVE